MPIVCGANDIARQPYVPAPDWRAKNNKRRNATQHVTQDPRQLNLGSSDIYSKIDPRFKPLSLPFDHLPPTRRQLRSVEGVKALMNMGCFNRAAVV
jgi:hypothetical protein